MKTMLIHVPSNVNNHVGVFDVKINFARIHVYISRSYNSLLSFRENCSLVDATSIKIFSLNCTFKSIVS